MKARTTGFSSNPCCDKPRTAAWAWLKAPKAVVKTKKVMLTCVGNVCFKKNKLQTTEHGVVSVCWKIKSVICVLARSYAPSGPCLLRPWRLALLRYHFLCKNNNYQDVLF